MKFHINYFDLGLWKFPHEIEIMLNEVFPKLDNITYSVYGFEANFEYANKIKEMYKNEHNISIINLAISNKRGIEKLYLDTKRGLGSSIFSSKPNVNKHQYYSVESNTFSGWINENNIDLNNKINILKVNIEGAELYLWEDIKNHKLRDKFQIFCGSLSHDILKVPELKNQINYYFNLLKELNVDFLRFCGEYCPEKNVNMVNVIKKYL